MSGASRSAAGSGGLLGVLKALHQHLSMVGLLLLLPTAGGLPAVLNEVLGIDKARTFVEVLLQTAPLCLAVLFGLLVILRSPSPGAGDYLLFFGLTIGALALGGLLGQGPGPAAVRAAVAELNAGRILARLAISYAVAYGWATAVQAVVIGASTAWVLHRRVLG